MNVDLLPFASPPLFPRKLDWYWKKRPRRGRIFYFRRLNGRRGSEKWKVVSRGEGERRIYKGAGHALGAFESFFTFHGMFLSTCGRQMTHARSFSRSERFVREYEVIRTTGIRVVNLVSARMYAYKKCARREIRTKEFPDINLIFEPCILNLRALCGPEKSARVRVCVHGEISIF